MKQASNACCVPVTGRHFVDDPCFRKDNGIEGRRLALDYLSRRFSLDGETEMYIVSRAIGQAVIVNEELVFTLAATAKLTASLIRTTGDGTHSEELEIRTGGFQEVAKGVAATYLPVRDGVARIGFIATAGVQIRCLDSSVLRTTPPAGMTQA